MEVSVIIPTCNRTDFLEHCLLRLTNGYQKMFEGEYEVIVTDDSDYSDSRLMISQKFPEVRWVKGEGKGPAANRNNGAKHATGKYLIFTDDDCLPDAHWLYFYRLAIFEHPNVYVFEGRTYPDSTKSSFAQIAPINEKGGEYFSCNIAFQAQFYWQFGGFDEDYLFSFEDMDMKHRLISQKKSVVFVKDAGVCHPYRNLTPNKMRKYLQNQKFGIKCFVRKHPEVIRSYNSFHFIREAIVNTAMYSLPNFIKYKGAGSYYLLMWRYMEVSIGFMLMPLTARFYLRKLFGK